MTQIVNLQESHTIRKARKEKDKMIRMVNKDLIVDKKRQAAILKKTNKCTKTIKSKTANTSKPQKQERSYILVCQEATEHANDRWFEYR